MSTQTVAIIKDLISHARKEEKKYRPILYFVSPCQVTVLLIKKHNLLFLLLKHNPEEADQQISEFIVDSLEAARAIINERFLADPYWAQREVVLRLAGIFSSILKSNSAASHFAKQIRKRPFQSDLVEGRAVNLEKLDGLLVCQVNTDKDNAEGILKTFREAQERFIKQRPYMHENFQQEYEYMLYAFWYPLFVFEDVPVTLEPRFVIKCEYRGYQLFFSNLSYMGILSPIKPPLKPFFPAAKECINEIIGVANLYGFNACGVGDEDVGTLVFTKDIENQVGMGRTMTWSVSRYLSERLSQDPYSVYQAPKGTIERHKTSEILDILKKAEKIAQNEELKSYVQLCLDAKSHFLIEQYKTSFLLAWIVVEKYIDSVWEIFLRTQNITGGRFTKLARSALWTIDDELESLNLAGKMPNEKYSQIVRLKRIRNDIIHNQRTVVLAEAEECVKLATDLVRTAIREKCFIE